jgi:hypothetical protein
VSAGIEAVPEAGPHAWFQARVVHKEAQGQNHDMVAARGSSVAGSRASAGLEESLWLCPIEDRRLLDSAREGIASVCAAWPIWGDARRDETSDWLKLNWTQSEESSTRVRIKHRCRARTESNDGPVTICPPLQDQ